MSNVIEQQILEMRFDNKQFEDNVAESIDTLGKLKESLKFDGVEKNFDALSNASNGVDFSQLNDKLTGLGEHISQVFKEIGIGALREFGASMERDVVNKIKDLTFGQFTEGWTKYNDKVQSVQTIMAATGLTIDEVNGYLEDLLWFSDETSYSFTDMTSNVAKFIGAGVEIGDSVTAMQGIATWAALAGKSSSEASRAMYNLSQAMGMGYVSLNDWRTIESLNMNMQSFGKVVLDTASALGTLQKYSDGTYQKLKEDGTAIDVTVENMRDTLSTKWFTKDVLTEVLNAYGNFATELAKVCSDIGISATEFMMAIGEYDGSIESIADICEETGISAEDLIPHLDRLSKKEYELGRQAFAASQESKILNDSIEATKDAVSTQWMNTFEYLFGNYEQAKKFFTQVTNTLWDMFATSGEVRNTILEQWSEVGGEIFRGGILNVLEGVSNIVSFIRETITDALGITGIAVDENGKIIETTSVFAGKLLEATKSFGKWAKEFADITANLANIVSTDDTLFIALYDAFELFGSALELVWTVLKSLAPLFKDVLVLFRSLYEFVGRWVVIEILNFAQALVDLIAEHRVLEKVIGGVTAVLSPFINMISSAIEWVSMFFRQIEILVEESGILQNIYKGISILFDPLIQKARTFFSLFREKLKMPEINFDFSNMFDKEKIQEFSDKIIPFFTSVREKFSDFFQLFESGFNKVSGIVSPVIEKVKEFFKAFDEKVDFSQFTSFHDILEKIRTKLEPVSDFLTKIFKNVKDFFSSIHLEKIFSDIWSFVTNITTKVWDFISNIDFSQFFSNLMTSLKNFGENVGTWLGQFISGIANGISGIFGGIKDNTNASFSGLFTNLTAGLLIFRGLKSGETEGGNILERIFSPLTSLFEDLKEKIDSFIEDTDDHKLRDIAVALGILAIALVAIASIDSERLDASLFSLAAMLAAMNLEMKQMANFDDTKGMKEAGMAMIELAGALLVISLAAKSFSDVGLEELGIIALTLTEMVGMFYAVGAISKATDMKELSVNMKQFSEAMAIMGVALRAFAWAAEAFDDIGIISNGMANVGISLIMMLAFAEFFKKIGADSSELLLGAAAMVVLGLGLQNMAAACKILEFVDPGAMGEALLLLLGLTGIAALMKALGADSVKLIAASVALALLGPAMISFSAGAIVMCEALRFLSKEMVDVDWGGLAKVAVMLTGIIVAMTAAIPIMTAFGTLVLSLGAGVALLGAGIFLIGAGLLEVSAALALINFARLENTLNGIGRGLKGIINEVGISLFLNNVTKALEILPALVSSIVSGLIVGIINGFSTILSTAKDFILNLINIFVELAPAIVEGFLTILTESLASVADSLGTLIPIVMDIVIKLLDALIEYLPPIVDKLAKIICIIFDKLTEHIPEMLTSFMNFVGALFGEILKVVEGTDQQTLLKIAEMFAGLVIIIEVLNLIKSAIPGAMAGLAEISLFVAELAVIIAAFGALNSIPGFQWLVEKGGDLLEAVGTAIGKFIGGIVGGLMEGATSTLPQVGTNIANFWNNIKPFIEGVSEVSAETVAKVGFLSACILALTASDFIGGISDFMRDKLNVQEFGMSIQKMWHNIKPFIEGVEDLNSKTVSSVESLSKAILILTAAQLIEGVRSFVFGKSDIDKFGESIGSLGPHLAKFSDSVKDIDNASVKVASEAIALLADTFSNGAFKTGGVVQWFSGEMTDLKKFGQGLVALGPMIKQYAASVAGLDNNVIQNSTIGAGALAEMANKLPRKGGIVGELRGDSDLVDFAMGLAVLGPQLKIYSLSVKGLDTNLVTNSINAAMAISELATKLPEKSIMDRIFGKDAMVEFAQNLNTFGTALKEYYDNISGIEYSQMSAMITATEELFTLFSGESGVTFKIDKDFKKAMKDIANSGITEFVTTLASSVETITTAGTEFISNFAAGVDETAHIVRESFDGMIQYCLDKVTNSLSQYRKAGRNLIENFALGISDTTKIVKASVNTILTAIYDQVTAETLKASFRKAGEDLMAKYAAGILSQVVLVAATASVVSAASLEQFNGEAVMTAYYNAGSGVMSEYVRGMEAQAPYVQRAAATIASSARSSVEGELQQLKNDINNWINNNVNFNPVITPTIDTSDLEAALRDLREEYADVLNSDVTSSSANSIISGYQAGVYPASHYQTIYDSSTGANIYVNANYNVNGSYDLDRANAELARRLERLYS